MELLSIIVKCVATFAHEYTVCITVFLIKGFTVLLLNKTYKKLGELKI